MSADGRNLHKATNVILLTRFEEGAHRRQLYRDDIITGPVLKNAGSINDGFNPNEEWRPIVNAGKVS